MTSTIIKYAAVLVVVTLTAVLWQYRPVPARGWTSNEVTVLRSLWLESLPELAEDPSNAVADNPGAVIMGARLFTDTRLSANGEISCATCHQPDRRFSDGLQKGRGIGDSRRNTPSIVGSAYSPWLYWDGRRDSLWSQALSPLEDANEHGTNRLQVVRLIAADDAYRDAYESLFGRMPEFASPHDESVNSVFANVGKVIAAFERTVMPTNARFDDYVAAVVATDDRRQSELYSDDEIRGLQLFIGDANCTQCHNGPLLTNNEFHNTGVISFPGEIPDKGRVAGLRQVTENEFNCRGKYSDDATHRCPELDFVRSGDELIGAVRTPSLRNLSGTAPYMHKGQFATLMDALEHYNRAPDAMIGHNEAKPLGLSTVELRQLESFLLTLAAPVGHGARLAKQTTSSGVDR